MKDKELSKVQIIHAGNLFPLLAAIHGTIKLISGDFTIASLTFCLDTWRQDFRRLLTVKYRMHPCVTSLFLLIIFPVFPKGQAQPVNIFSDLAWPKPAGLVNPDPGQAGPGYRPDRLFPGYRLYRLFPGCSVSTAKFTVNISQLRNMIKNKVSVSLISKKRIELIVEKELLLVDQLCAVGRSLFRKHQ